MATQLFIGAQAERHQRRLLAEELPARRSVVLPTPTGQQPVTWVDLAGRKDVQKLWRAHAKTGEGDFAVDWAIFTPRHRGRLFVGEWRFTKPARCRFSLIWDAVEDIWFLEAICKAGRLVLTQRNLERTGPSVGRIGTCLILPVNTERLRDLLIAARTCAALRVAC